MKIISDNRFRSVEVEIHFINQVSLDLSVRNLVKDFLVDSSLIYNSKQKIRMKLDDMYGATLKANSKVMGQLHDICFSGSVIHDLYTMNQEENIQEYLNFLREIIYNPYFTEEKLNELKMNLEKANRFKIRAESKLEELNSRKEELLKELHQYGIEPENLNDEIEKLKKEIEDGIREANELLPLELLEKINDD